jgi:hypothetical protein
MRTKGSAERQQQQQENPNVEGFALALQGG